MSDRLTRAVEAGRKAAADVEHPLRCDAWRSPECSCGARDQAYVLAAAAVLLEPWPLEAWQSGPGWRDQGLKERLAELAEGER